MNAGGKAIENSDTLALVLRSINGIVTHSTELSDCRIVTFATCGSDNQSRTNNGTLIPIRCNV